MIYAAFAVWLFLALFVGAGIFRLWTSLLPPRWVNIALLPGTAVSELAYIFGCLITGGEVRRAKLMDGGGGGGKGKSKGEGGDGGPTSDASPGLKGLGLVLASLLAIAACGAGILLVHSLLGEPVMQEFNARLLQDVPTDWSDFWSHLDQQVSLVRATAETYGDLSWLDWRVPLFVYLALCLSIQLAPVRRPMRPTLAAVVLIAALIALIGVLSSRFRGLIDDVWPLLTYVWSSLLLVLSVTLVVRGIVGLVNILRGK